MQNENYNNISAKTYCKGWIEDLKEYHYGFGTAKAICQDGMPHGTDISDPTFEACMLREGLAQKVGLITKAIETATHDDEMKNYIAIFIDSPGHSIEELYEIGMDKISRKEFFMMIRTVYDYIDNYNK